jgi:hypothetical protein
LALAFFARYAIITFMNLDPGGRIAGRIHRIITSRSRLAEYRTLVL